MKLRKLFLLFIILIISIIGVSCNQSTNSSQTTESSISSQVRKLKTITLKLNYPPKKVLRDEDDDDDDISFDVVVWINAVDFLKPLTYTFSDLSSGSNTIKFGVPYGEDRLIEVAIYQNNGIRYPVYYGTTVVDVDENTSEVSINLNQSFAGTVDNATYPQVKVYKLFANGEEEVPENVVSSILSSKYFFEMSKYYSTFSNLYPIVFNGTLPVKDLWSFTINKVSNYENLNTALNIFNNLSQPSFEYKFYLPFSFYSNYTQFIYEYSLSGPFGHSYPDILPVMETGNTSGLYYFYNLSQNNVLQKWEINATGDIPEANLLSDIETVISFNLLNATRFENTPYILWRESNGYFVPYPLTLPHVSTFSKNQNLTFTVNSNFTEVSIWQGDINSTQNTTNFNIVYDLYTYNIPLNSTVNGSNFTPSINTLTISFQSQQPIYIAYGEVFYNKSSVFSRLKNRWGDYFTQYFFSRNAYKKPSISGLNISWDDASVSAIIGIANPLNTGNMTIAYNNLPDTSQVNIRLLTAEGNLYEIKKTIEDLKDNNTVVVPDANFNATLSQSNSGFFSTHVLKITTSGNNATLIKYCDITKVNQLPSELSDSSIPFYFLKEFLFENGAYVEGVYKKVDLKRLKAFPIFISSSEEGLIITCYSEDENFKVTQIYKAMQEGTYYTLKKISFPVKLANSSNPTNFYFSSTSGDLIVMLYPEIDYQENNPGLLFAWRKQENGYAKWQILYSAGAEYSTSISPFFYYGQGNYTLYVVDYKAKNSYTTNLEVSILPQETYNSTYSTLTWNATLFTNCTTLQVYAENSDNTWTFIKSVYNSGSTYINPGYNYILTCLYSTTDGYELKFQKFIPVP